MVKIIHDGDKSYAVNAAKVVAIISSESKVSIYMEDHLSIELFEMTFDTVIETLFGEQWQSTNKLIEDDDYMCDESLITEGSTIYVLHETTDFGAQGWKVQALKVTKIDGYGVFKIVYCEDMQGRAFHYKLIPDFLKSVYLSASDAYSARDKRRIARLDTYESESVQEEA